MRLTNRLQQVIDVRISMMEAINGHGKRASPKGISADRWSAMHKALRWFVDCQDIDEQWANELAEDRSENLRVVIKQVRQALQVAPLLGRENKKT